MIKILLLAGGFSAESEVSKRSGSNVEKALVVAGYEVDNCDPKTISESELINKINSSEVVFPVLHGEWGEDGTLQTILEEQNAKFVGSDSKSSKLCINKQLMREIAEKNNIKIAEGAVFSKPEYLESKIINTNHVVKPVVGGSSIDTFIVNNNHKSQKQDILNAFDKYTKMIVEELIVGIEITVGVLGNKPLPVIEIIPPSNENFDYENKYNGETQEICPPINVSKETQIKAQELTLKIHKLFGCRDMSRTDFIVKPNQELVLLDVNTIPGLTKQSLLPNAAYSAGYDMPNLVDALVKMALNR